MTFSSAVGRGRDAVRVLLTPGPRMVDEIECVASVLLAVFLAHLLGSRYVAWAAFTGFVLMRSHAAETLVRGMMRIAGTVAGAGLALAVLPFAETSLVVTTLAVAIVGTVGLYGMLTGRRAYAWLLFGITFEMVLLAKLEHPATDMLDFARTRLIEVVAGTVACVTVSLAAALTARRRWPGMPPASAARIGWHPHAARHAVQAGLALALLPPLHALFGLGNLEQAAVTILAVMIVPVSGLGESGLGPVNQRLLQRMLGCLAGSLLALVILLVARGSAEILIAGTCIGIIIGRHIENGGARSAYLGLQFTLAIIVVLVPDSYSDVAIEPALLRLLSILIGMALLEPVLLIWHALAPASRATATVSGAGSDE